MKGLPDNITYTERIREPGAGRKRYDNIAGIYEKLAEKYQIYVSTQIVRKLLRKHNYRKRKAQKKQTMKAARNRNEQFEKIAQIKSEYEDFNSFADGTVVPHSIYDLRLNTGYINLGTSKDTSEFACDSLRNWWYNFGQYAYPHATSILILCDGGGSNNSHNYLFKEDLQKLVNEINVEIRIAHYPPYTSKYNPIEHRLFPHVTEACQGVVFKSVEFVKELM